MATRPAKAESLISHCPSRLGQVATQDFSNGLRPSWIGSRCSLRRSRSDTPYLILWSDTPYLILWSDTPYLLEHGDEDKDPRQNY
jgi:hypothetical protein